ncbi:putative D-glucarate or D-galactorate regulator, GntR family [Pseudomonas chlororaphis subsp. piscium]|nr:putative D-glucarate or D-galactorate regulator, GntR family [Pseudomonas chlororaphis subsp. piscium]
MCSTRRAHPATVVTLRDVLAILELRTRQDSDAARAAAPCP